MDERKGKKSGKGKESGKGKKYDGTLSLCTPQEELAAIARIKDIAESLTPKAIASHMQAFATKGNPSVDRGGVGLSYEAFIRLLRVLGPKIALYSEVFLATQHPVIQGDKALFLYFIGKHSVAFNQTPDEAAITALENLLKEAKAIITESLEKSHRSRGLGFHLFCANHYHLIESHVKEHAMLRYIGVMKEGRHIIKGMREEKTIQQHSDDLQRSIEFFMHDQSMMNFDKVPVENRKKVLSLLLLRVYLQGLKTPSIPANTKEEIDAQCKELQFVIQESPQAVAGFVYEVAARSLIGSYVKLGVWYLESAEGPVREERLRQATACFQSAMEVPRAFSPPLSAEASAAPAEGERYLWELSDVVPPERNTSHLIFSERQYPSMCVPAVIGLLRVAHARGHSDAENQEQLTAIMAWFLTCEPGSFESSISCLITVAGIRLADVGDAEDFIPEQRAKILAIFDRYSEGFSLLQSAHLFASLADLSGGVAHVDERQTLGLYERAMPTIRAWLSEPDTRANVGNLTLIFMLIKSVLNYVDLSDKNEGSKRRILEDLMMVREVLQVLPKDRGFEMLYRVEMGLGSAVALPAGARLDHYENASALCRQAGQAETQNALLAYYHSIALVMASGSLGTVKNLRQASSYIKPLQRMASGVRTKLERKLSLSQGDLALQIAEWGKRVDPAAILEMMQKLASTLQAKPTEASGASRDALVLASAQGAASSAPSDDPSLVVAGEHLTHHAS